MASKKPASNRPPKAKPRKHGYRGYGSGLARDKVTYGGAVHMGRGFAGVGPLGTDRTTLPEAELFSEDLKEKTPKS